MSNLPSPLKSRTTMSVTLEPAEKFVRPPRPVQLLAAQIVVESEEVSFARFASPPPETVTMLTAGEEALLLTLTVSVIGGNDVPPATASLRVQVRLPALQLQPVPLMPVAV